MNETKTESTQIIKSSKPKTVLPFIVALIGIIMMAASLFLPHITAVGTLAEYIEAHPDVVENKELGLITRDLADIPLVSIDKIFAAAYTKADGLVASIIIKILYGSIAITSLFVLFRKAIPTIIFDLITSGIFLYISNVTKEDLTGENKYAFSTGYYTMIIAAVIVLVGAIWLLVSKIAFKRSTKLNAKKEAALAQNNIIN